MKVKSLQLCLTLCNPIDSSLPCSSVHGVFQVRILEWVAIPSPGDLPDPGIEHTPLMPSALAGRFFITSATWDLELLLTDMCPSQCYKG